MKKNKIFLLAFFLCFSFFALKAQDPQPQKSMEVYGFVMTDAGYNFNQIDPNWFDCVRPTKLPSYKNEFGTDGHTYFSVRQTRFGVKSSLPTALGDLKTVFEFELFGTGVDAGQTTFRLRHAYAELGHFGVGQTWSPFMDGDVFPNSLEYWGPVGMVFFRNIQIRWMPIMGDTRLTIALERPGASADQGDYAERIQVENVKGHTPLPDLSAEYRYAGKFGYVELAGIVRYMAWEDIDSIPATDLSDNAIGWGLNLSSNINFTKSTVGRFQVVYGQGIENYMNDAPADIGIKVNENDTTDISGVTLPVLGVVAFVDQQWSKKFSSTIGYSMVNIDNTNGQQANAFKSGNYALANLLYYPVENAMLGVEVQYGDRKNFDDGWDTNI
jgi:hypothetical protein